MSRLRVMLELVTAEGTAVVVNPAHVRAVSPADKGARLEFGDGQEIVVRQSVDAVAAKVDYWLGAYVGDR